MVLEELLSAERAEKHPLIIFFMAAVVTAVAMLSSYFFFPDNTGLIMVFLIVIGMLPLFHNIIEYEELKDLYSRGKKISFFKRHADIIITYTAFFFGISMSIAILSSVLPGAMTNAVFSNQLDELEAVRSNLSGRFFDSGLYEHILLNNMKIMGIGFALAFVFGTGGLIILTWNGSILGVLVGSLIRSIGPSGFHTGFLTFLPHGILEIAGFFTAGIAAGILSESLVHWKTDSFWYVLKDGLMLFGLSATLIFAAAAVEVMIM